MSARLRRKRAGATANRWLTNPGSLRNRIATRLEPWVDFYSARLNKREGESLLALAASPRLEDKKLCVAYLRLIGSDDRNTGLAVRVIDLLIPCCNSRCSALLVLEEIAERNPEAAWPLVVKWGSDSRSNVRMLVASCVLESILRDRFREYFDRVRTIIESGNWRFGETLSHCYRLGQAKYPRNSMAWDELESFVNLARKARRRDRR